MVITLVVGQGLQDRPAGAIAHRLRLWAPSPTVKESVGDRVRRARKLAGFGSQDGLAAAAGVPRGYIADLESNAVTAPRFPDRLKKVAKACKVSFRWLRGGTEWDDEDDEFPPWDTSLLDHLIQQGSSEDESIKTVEAMRLLISRRPIPV